MKNVNVIMKILLNVSYLITNKRVDLAGRVWQLRQHTFGNRYWKQSLFTNQAISSSLVDIIKSIFTIYEEHDSTLASCWSQYQETQNEIGSSSVFKMRFDQVKNCTLAACRSNHDVWLIQMLGGKYWLALKIWLEKH